MEALFGFISSTGTGPLVMSEVGWDTDSSAFNSTDTDLNDYEHFISSWIKSNQLGFGFWQLGGSYYIRQGTVGPNDTFSLLNWDFTAVKNPYALTFVQNMFTSSEELNDDAAQQGDSNEGQEAGMASER
jgi:hypothetical protein